MRISGSVSTKAKIAITNATSVRQALTTDESGHQNVTCGVVERNERKITTVCISGAECG